MRIRRGTLLTLSLILLVFFFGFSAPWRMETSDKTLFERPSIITQSMHQAKHMFESFKMSTSTDDGDFNDVRYFVADGFEYCAMLNGATFDSLVHWEPLNGSVASYNPSMREFTSIIDRIAERIATDLGKQYTKLLPEHARRYSCHLTAEGNTPLARLTSFNSLMKHVDPYVFLNDVLPTLHPSASQIPGPRRHYKLAYLILLHEKWGMDHYKKFLSQLDDGDAVILVHADPRDPSVQEELQRWADMRAKDKRRTSNIYFCRSKYEGVWGHMALVWMELSGFWELLDLADWDYAINLSGFDWPLRSNKEIHRTMESNPKYKGKNMVHFWNDTHQSATRFYRPHIAAMWGGLEIPKEGGLRHLPAPIADWKAMKQSQWMVLTEDFVSFLRTDFKSLMMAVFMENIGIPDEAYFGTVLWNTPRFHSEIVNTNKRFIRIWGAHPHWLHMENTVDIPRQDQKGAEADFFWIRKVDSIKDADFVEWIQKNHIGYHDSK